MSVQYSNLALDATALKCVHFSDVRKESCELASGLAVTPGWPDVNFGPNSCLVHAMNLQDRTCDEQIEQIFFSKTTNRQIILSSVR